MLLTALWNCCSFVESLFIPLFQLENALLHLMFPTDETFNVFISDRESFFLTHFAFSDDLLFEQDIFLLSQIPEPSKTKRKRIWFVDYLLGVQIEIGVVKIY